MNVGKELAALRRMAAGELRSRYAEVFGETTNTYHKDWLIKRIIYRMQVLAEGDFRNEPASGLPSWPTTPTCDASRQNRPLRNPPSSPQPRVPSCNPELTHAFRSPAARLSASIRESRSR